MSNKIEPEAGHSRPRVKRSGVSFMLSKCRPCSCCAAFCTFVFVGIVIVPIAVFVISAFFAIIMWGIECKEAKDEYGDDVDDEAPGMCDYYQWWVYIVGNLVGVQVAEIDGPLAGHKFAEIVDLLVSVWSLTIAGLVIGLVGSLAWVNVLTESADERMTGAFSKALRVGDAVREATVKGDLGFNAFLKLCTEKGINVPEERLRQVFEEADLDKSGAIDAAEVDKLLELLEAQGDADAPPTTRQLAAKLDAMEAKLDKALAALSANTC